MSIKKNRKTPTKSKSPSKDQMTPVHGILPVSTPMGRAQARRLKRINEKNVADRLIKEEKEKEMDKKEAERRRQLLMSLE